MSLRVERGIGENPLIRRIRQHTFMVHKKSVDILEKFQGGNWHVVKTVLKIRLRSGKEIKLTPDQKEVAVAHNNAHYENNEDEIAETREKLPVELIVY